MKSNLSKNIFLPAIFGLFFYLFITLGANANLISQSKILNILGISLGVLGLYGIVIGMLKNNTNLAIGLAGFNIGRFLFGFIIPIVVSVYKFYFYIPSDHYNSILEKENIEFTVDFKECHKIKYGTFIVQNYDTIIRYNENNKDYEIVKTFDSQTTNRIKWLDSCSYLRFNESNGLASEYLRLGNFEGRTHYLYSKPSSSHKLSDEKIEMVIEVKTNSKLK
ncbi:hypothetical protein [Mariniflexile sp. HMF6888]|uniref:hypothetical protein n=1 Tax=Mariniflexile sp. HMF6888 TaxID=3373086 RepID=UPI003794B0B1